MFRRATASLSLGCSLIALVGCRPDDDKRVDHTSSLWNGDHDEDPANDFARLQGRWGRKSDSAKAGSEFAAILTIKNHDAEFEYPDLFQRGAKDGREKYTFVLNSSRTPKAMRFVTLVSNGKAISLPWNHPGHNRRYALVHDVLTIWTVHAEQGEQPKHEFVRMPAHGK